MNNFDLFKEVFHYLVDIGVFVYVLIRDRNKKIHSDLLEVKELVQQHCLDDATVQATLVAKVEMLVNHE